MTKLLISKLPAFVPDDFILRDAAKYASDPIMTLLLDLSESHNWDELITAALESDNPGSLSVLLSRASVTGTDEQKQAFFERAMEVNASAVVAALDRWNPIFKGKTMYRNLLTWAIRSQKRSYEIKHAGRLELVRYLLTKVSPATSTNQALKTVVKEGDLDLLALSHSQS